MIEPLVSSSKYWEAPPSVTAWSACMTVARWCGPKMCPLRVLRFTVIETRRIMCGGTTEASLFQRGFCVARCTGQQLAMPV